MFGDREIHRKLSGAGGYAAERLAEISDSLGQLAKIMKNSGEDPGLSREDGIAALESAASMVCGSCDRCGMKQECLDEQDGEHYFLYYLYIILYQFCVHHIYMQNHLEFLDFQVIVLQYYSL